jgi:hypothetical protein
MIVALKIYIMTPLQVKLTIKLWRDKGKHVNLLWKWLYGTK